MTEYDPWNILKWVLLVLAAGFVGQFGKTLAQYLMRRAKEKAAAAARRPSGDAPAVPARTPGREAAAEVSNLPAAGAGSPKPMPGAPAGEEIEAEAKAAKALAKAKKKEAKLLKKLFK